MNTGKENLRCMASDQQVAHFYRGVAQAGVDYIERLEAQRDHACDALQDLLDFVHMIAPEAEILKRLNKETE